MAVIVRRAPAPPPLLTAVGSLMRARRVVQRNMLVYSHSWIVLVSGFFEPLFYLLGIGFGLGSLIGTIDLLPGPAVFEVPFAAFVAPGLLAMSAMNGAIAETIFNVFFKLNYEKTYEGMLATPIGIREIALGELLWSLMRGGLYATAFIAVMLAMGLVFSWWTVLVLPAAILLGAAFSAAGLATTTFLRTVQDFDLPMGLVVMPMFLFSGVFFPISVYPIVIQAIMQVIPLYRGVHLLRSLTTGVIDLTVLVDVGYLLAFFAVAITIAMRRMETRLIQ